ncbi:hypothetical protein PENSPDRAFT_508574 [Peniophora sp. CONT]|nr:hypothetical protein PENSPDRAFT_508574 [Peniophora sp. CONT]
MILPCTTPRPSPSKVVVDQRAGDDGNESAGDECLVGGVGCARGEKTQSICSRWAARSDLEVLLVGGPIVSRGSVSYVPRVQATTSHSYTLLRRPCGRSLRPCARETPGSLMQSRLSIPACFNPGASFRRVAREGRELGEEMCFGVLNWSLRPYEEGRTPIIHETGISAWTSYATVVLRFIPLFRILPCLLLIVTSILTMQQELDSVTEGRRPSCFLRSPIAALLTSTL